MNVLDLFRNLCLLKERRNWFQWKWEGFQMQRPLSSTFKHLTLGIDRQNHDPWLGKGGDPLAFALW